MSWTRRRFLRGVGVSLGLPWLPSLQPRAAQAATPAPARFLTFYVPNGIHMPAWTPTVAGHDFELPPLLQPLASVRDQLTVISGLRNGAAIGWTGTGDHGSGTGAFLTNVNPTRAGGQTTSNAVSLDQVMAAELEPTPFPSLQLGIDGGASAGLCDSGDSCVFTRNISWADATSPLAKEVNPVSLFDRMVQGGQPEAGLRKRTYRKSVLDYVRRSASRLQTELGSDDRAKLDEYLSGVRELEVRIDALAEAPKCDGEPPVADDVSSKVRAMCDLMVMAFRCDLTRVITFMLGNAASNRVYGFLGVPDLHHEISHHGGDPTRLDQIQTINMWEMQQLAYLLERLRATPDGDGHLLDRTLVYFSSEISDGDSHSHENLPIVLAGTAAGSLEPGRHVVADGASVGDLYVSFLNMFGIERRTFGEEGQGPLSAL